MLFNTLDFALFLPLVFLLYWGCQRSLNLQNTLVVCASYVFYGWWDWRFLGLIVLSTAVDFYTGQGIGSTNSPKARKRWLALSVLTNLGILGVFKYFNFFAQSLQSALTTVGLEASFPLLNIVLPVGISFYTFQTLSYSIDVYRGSMKPCKDPIAFAAYVSFFPQLVAGPIERAQHLLPQFTKRREFNYSQSVDGCRQILWGLFKKVVIADNCAEYVNLIFNTPQDYSASTLVLGVVLFSFQIYGDFSGYSDIAIGCARFFGFNLRQNFATPYFSRDIAEFWRRWHISLSSWFRDYVYIPIGGSRGTKGQHIKNVFIIFLISGLWHGANWTFVIWGALNALFFLPLLLRRKNRHHVNTVAQGKLFPSIKECLAMAMTYALTLLAWVFFRADSLGHALEYLSLMADPDILSAPQLLPIITMGAIGVLLVMEWFGREQPHALHSWAIRWPKAVRWCGYVGIALLTLLCSGKEQEFIYFQF